MALTFKRTRDIDKIKDIVIGLGDFFDEDSYDELDDDVEDDDVFGAFEDGKLLGFIIFCELNPQVIELTWMAVDKKARGKGIGKQLIAYGLEQIQKGHHYKLCYLKTIGEGDRQRSFEATRQFYIKLGFIPLESIRPYPGWYRKKYVQAFVLPLNN